MEKFDHPEINGIDSEVENKFHSYLEYFPLTEEDLKKPLLDVGAGDGNFIKYVRNIFKNKDAHGIDKQSTKAEYSREGIIPGDSLAIPFPNDFFQTVIAKNYLPMFLENIDDAKKALEELIRVTKSGGKIMFDIFTPEEISELLHAAEMEKNEKGIAQLKSKYSGSVYFQKLLGSLKTKGYDINFREIAAKKSNVVIIQKPLL